MPVPIPSVILVELAARITALEQMVGETVDDFCEKYGSIGDELNHCAHFVGHALKLRIPGAALCSNVAGSENTYAERRTGYCIRVNQIFNNCSGRAYYADDSVPITRLIVATIAGNITSKNPLTIGSHRTKHVGFLVNSNVYHYSNTKDEVVKQPIETFRNHYGAKTVLLVCDLPAATA